MIILIKRIFTNQNAPPVSTAPGVTLEKCLNRGFFHILFGSYWVAVHTFLLNAIVKGGGGVGSLILLSLLISGVHDTGGIVTIGIVATVARLPTELLTSAANLTPVPPPVFWIRIGILIRIRIHLVGRIRIRIVNSDLDPGGPK
jgi:hypothetical protein